MKSIIPLGIIHLCLASATQAASLVPPGWDPVRAGDQIMERLVTVTAPQVKGAHDAEMALVGDHAYIVAEVNDVRPGEAAGWPEIHAAMSLVNLKTLAVEKIIPFARSEQVFENATLPVGACFVPRILQKDDQTLRCYFASEQPGRRQAQTWFRDFDLVSGAFENRIHKAQLKTTAGVFDMQPQHFHADAAAQGFRKPAQDFGLYLFDSFKQFDGQTYVAINNFAGKQNALALVHDDFATFEVVGHYNEPQNLQLSESAVNRLPDGTWMAICRQDGGNGNYTFTTSRDGKTWTRGEHRPFIHNGANSKPTFDKFGGVYYLGWQEATRIQGVSRSVFNIDISRDGATWERKYRFETPKSFQYPTFRLYQGVIWLCVTQGDKDASRKERIMFGRLEDVGQFAQDDTLAAGRIGFYGSQGLVRVKNIRVTGTAKTAAGDFVLPPPAFVYVCEDAGAGGYEAFPDVCRLSDGRLMCVFYAGYGHVALPNDQLPRGGRIAYCLSSDEGRTWSAAETLYDGPDDDRDPSIVQLKSGRMVCNFFSLRKGTAGRSYEGLGSWMIVSDDLGKTWSPPQQISKTHYCSAPIRELSNGRLILGLYTEQGKKSQGSVVFSDDGGKTWQPEVLIDNGGIQLDAETDVIELKDGTLYAAQRPHMCFATSKDRGATWTVSQPMGFPGHCPYFLRTKNDVILLAFRVPNTSLRFSRDECKTWSDNVLIDEVGGAYPSMVNLKDGSVLVVYYEEGPGSSIRAKRLRVTAKGIEWLPPSSH